MTDRARQKTDKQLAGMERRIAKVYSSSLALRRIQKKYDAYMKSVQKQTEDSYRAYKDEADSDIKQELKKAYMDEVKALTLQSREYKRIVDEFAQVMAEVNQQAVDVANDEVTSIYVTNYNQVADECKRVGITVNGKSKE